ncbi:hypothetical protein ACFWR9_31285, partial [Streptomyces sp. NPDC058534]
MTALFALATSLLWGMADFGGGVLTRRTPALTVVVVSQSVAVAVLGTVVAAPGARGEAGPPPRVAVAAGGGRAGGVRGSGWWGTDGLGSRSASTSQFGHSGSSRSGRRVRSQA